MALWADWPVGQGDVCCERGVQHRRPPHSVLDVRKASWRKLQLSWACSIRRSAGRGTEPFNRAPGLYMGKRKRAQHDWSIDGEAG